MFGAAVVQAVQNRAVSLTGLAPQLNGVKATATEPVMVGVSGTRAAVMGGQVSAVTPGVHHARGEERGRQEGFAACAFCLRLSFRGCVAGYAQPGAFGGQALKQGG